MLSAHSDWLARARIASIIHDRVTREKQNGFLFRFVFAFVAVLLEINQLLDRLIIQLVRYILKQLFTSVSVKLVDIYFAASRLGKYPQLSYSPPLR